MNYLLDYGIDIESKTVLGRTPLHLAVIKNNIEITEILLNCGAQINSEDNEHNTPLHHACMLGYENIVELLVKRKAKVNLINNYGQNCIDLVFNYKIFEIISKYHKNAQKLRNNYTRLIHNKNVFHNNRVDHIRRILYLNEKLSDKIKMKNFFHQSHSKDNITLDSFEIISPIGKGSFGEVYLVELKSTKERFAMKILNKNKILSQNIVRYIITEKNVLSSLNHPYIVKLCFAIQTDDFLYLILEYCPNGDLCLHLQKEKKFDEQTVRLISAQILLSLEELHKHNIIYRDLKPENIVLDENFFAKLTDFGLSKEGITDNCSAKSFCGSLAYLAPEVINRQGHGKSVDWYLFGILIYELLFGQPPYYTTKSKEALFNNIKFANLTFPHEISEDAKNIIIKLLNRNPNKRLGSGCLDANEIKVHPFFKSIDFKKIYDKKFSPVILSSTQRKSTNFINEEIDKLNKKIKNEILKKESKKEVDQKKNIEGWTFIRKEDEEI